MRLLYRCLCVILLSFFGILSALAQVAVSGQVRSVENGAPLQGVLIRAKGVRLNATTNAEGVFSVIVPNRGTVLTFSFVGFITDEVKIQDQTDLIVRLIPDALSLKEVVVTGTFDQRTKLQSSVAITILNPRLIDSRNALGTAALLQAVPGVFTNNSSGEATGAVYVRGLVPIAGVGSNSFNYVSLQEDGLPVIATPLNLAVPDAFQRTDLTVAKMEAVRGGSASITGANTPGGIFNFISKRGSDQFTGSARAQTGLWTNGNLYYRADAEVGGPLAKGLFYHIGGFYRYDEGGRKAPYPLNKGGQIRANVHKEFDRGYLRLYGKYLQDNNQRLNGLPVNSDFSQGFQMGPNTPFRADSYMASGAPVAYANPFDYDPTKPSSQNPTIEYNPAKINLNLTYSGGAEFQYALTDKLLLNVKGRVSYFQSNNNQPAVDIAVPTVPSTADLGYGVLGASALLSPATWQAGLQAAGVPAAQAAVQAQGIAQAYLGSVLSPTYYNGNTGEVLARVIGGRLDPTVPNKIGSYYHVYGLVAEQDRISNQMANLNLGYSVGNHSFDVGSFVAFGQNEDYRAASGVAETFSPDNPVPIQIKFTAPTGLPPQLFGGQTFEASTKQGIAASNLNYNQSTNTSSQVSVYASDNWQASNRLLLDAGLRYESIRQTNDRRPYIEAFEFTGLNGLDGNPLTLFDLVARVGAPTRTVTNYSYNYLSFSVGANYKLNENAAIYGRFTRGNKAYEMDYFLENATRLSNPNPAPIEAITQVEAGFKIKRKGFSLSAVPFYSLLNNVRTVYTAITSAGLVYSPPTFNSAETKGLELEVDYRPTKQFNVRGSITYQDARFRSFTYANIEAWDGVDARKIYYEDFSGNKVSLPTWMVDVTPMLQGKRASVYLNYRWQDRFAANRRNTLFIPAYGLLNGGASYNLSPKLTVGVQVNNLLNNAALTYIEGFAINGTTREDYAVGGVRGINGEIRRNTDLNELNRSGRPLVGIPLLPRFVLLSVTTFF